MMERLKSLIKSKKKSPTSEPTAPSKKKKKKDCDIQQSDVLAIVSYQSPNGGRFGRGPGKVTTICWQTKKEHLASQPLHTSLKTEPFAAFEQALGLPERQRAQLTQCLQLLRSDQSKLYDVRVLRGFVLENIAVGAYKALELDLPEHEECGVLAVPISLQMSSGRCCDWFSSPNTTIVSAALTSLLVAAAKKVLKNPISVHVVCKLKRNGGFFSTSSNPHWTSIVRTANGCDAVLLGQSIGTTLVKELVASVPLRDVLGLDAPKKPFVPKYGFDRDTRPGPESQVRYESELEDEDNKWSPDDDITTFDWSLEKIQTVGGKIVDIIDPSRTDAVSDKGVPVQHWVPALVNPRAPPVGLFVSEISGIPTDTSQFVPATDSRPTSSLSKQLYGLLGEVFHRMLPMFRKLSVDIDSPILRVVVKAQTYVLREGDSITGQMHREGLESDNITAVGLYYPDVDAKLKGGVLELTRVMRGGCGSRYPHSTEVPIQKGSAVVFENMNTFHRMTTLSFAPKSAASDKTLERTVIAFFLQKGDSASSADVQVNCHSKMRLSLRELEQRVNLRRLLTVQRAGSSASSYQRGCLRLSRALRSRIVAFAAGGSEERMASFRAQRGRRLQPVTRDGLTRMACD